MPVKVFADDDDDVPGGSLLRTLMHLFQGLGDIINGEEEKSITVKTNKNLRNIKMVELNITTQVLS